ncbi:methyl-accepting chemotaxis protein [Vibrio lentus]
MIIKEVKNVSIAIRVWAILALFAIALLANTILNIDGSRQHVRESYQKGVKTLVQSAVSVVRYYQSQSEIGNLSEEEARARALETISNMRFDDGNYIFIGDREGKQIATGVPSLLGKNIMDLQDSKGKYFVREMYSISKNGGGFIDYHWKNPNKQTLEPKTSYAIMLEPWGWMVGSGVNMVALQATTHRAEMTSIGYAIGILAVLSLIVGYFIKTITLPLNRTLAAMKALSKGEGDLTQRIPEEGSKELIFLARYFNQFVESIQSMMLGIQGIGTQVSASATQLTDSVHQIDNSLNQQRNDVDMLATAMTEMLATVEEVAGRTVEANEASRFAAQETQKSSSIIQNNVIEANEMAEVITSAGQAVQKLALDAKNVDTVLEVIRGVAEQTNLLALNAAIEAARAGDHGRGFAVVADEVRTLSQRTQESTLEIQNIIEKLQVGAENVVTVMYQGVDKANKASELSAQAGCKIDESNKQVNKIEGMAQHIATAAEEQTLTVNEINRNVASLSDMATLVSSESTEMANSSRELRGISENLMCTINRFKLA